MVIPNYALVTDNPSVRVRPEALAMAWTRYSFAASWCAGATVLELGCGPGPGLGWLARGARLVVGADLSPELLRAAKTHYGDRVAYLRLDAHRIPLASHSVDVAVMFEAIYYLDSPDVFLRDCRRVLRPGGVLLLCLVNKAWREFNPGAYTRHYYAPRELADVLTSAGFSAEVLGAFPTNDDSAIARARALVRRAAASLGLIPDTVRGKELLKRLFYGRLVPYPAELKPGDAPYCEPRPVALSDPQDRYKVLFAVARPLP